MNPMAERSMEGHDNASPQSYSVQTNNAAVPSLPSPGNSEEADNYHSVLFQISDKWRVIECRGQIQWILQSRSGTRNGMPRWQSRNFCLTAIGLSRCIHEASGPLAGVTGNFISSLPARHPGPSNGR